MILFIGLFLVVNGQLLPGLFGNQPNNFQQGGGGLDGLLGGLLGGQGGGRPQFGGQRGQGGLLQGLLGGQQGGRGPNGQPGLLQNIQGQGGLNNIGNMLNEAVRGNPAAMNGIRGLVNQIASIPIGIVQQAVQVDVVSDLLVMQKGPPPSQNEWNRRARKFCRRFPGHPNCRGGQMPLYSDINNMLTVIMGSVSEFLPKVPRMDIKDPLQNVDRGLAGQLQGNVIRLGELQQPAAQSLRGVCRNFKCQQQPSNAFATKQLVQAKVFEFEKAKLGRDNSDAIQLRFDRTQQLKEALLEKAQLGSQVFPVNNGIFDSDILLTERQSNFMLNELGKAGVGADPKRLPRNASLVNPEDFDPSLGKNMTDRLIRLMRKQRASVFFEDDPVKKWDPFSPIQYSFDDSLEVSDQNDVRGAINEIQRRSCLRFQEVSGTPSGSHIMYYKLDSPTFCGLSYVGKNDPANPIYLSFGCSNNRGIALHETLHALGMSHQHLRPDRDQYLNIDWSNVNPQMYDSFAVVDAKLFTTYGVRYDYGSVMHYNAYMGAINVAKPTMLPKFDYNANINRLGQRDGMSNTDAELLNKMYCMQGCDDNNVYCGAWALRGLCNSGTSVMWMRSNCRKSCNLCDRF